VLVASSTSRPKPSTFERLSTALGIFHDLVYVLVLCVPGPASALAHGPIESSSSWLAVPALPCHHYSTGLHARLVGWLVQ
jgi:hypothetical protein